MDYYDTHDRFFSFSWFYCDFTTVPMTLVKCLNDQANFLIGFLVLTRTKNKHDQPMGVHCPQILPSSSRYVHPYTHSNTPSICNFFPKLPVDRPVTVALITSSHCLLDTLMHLLVKRCYPAFTTILISPVVPLPWPNN